MKLSNKSILLIAFISLSLLTSYFSLMEYHGENIFIGHADQANLANLAQNVARGNGFVVDTVWIHTNGGLPGNEVTHSEPYWSIYAAAFVSIAFSLLGENRLALVMPALAMKILVVGITTYWCWRISERRLLPTITAMAVLSFSPQLLGAVNGLSDVYLTAGILAGLTSLSFATKKQNAFLFFLAGLFSGLSMGFKPSGILLLSVWPLYLILANISVRTLQQGVVFVIGLMAALAPYLYYNKVSYDTWTAAGNSYVAHAADIRYYRDKNGLNNAHNDAFYNPNSIALPEQKARVQKMLTHLKDFISNGAIKAKLTSGWLVPLILVGVILIGSKFWIRSERIIENETEIFTLYAFALLLGGVCLSLFVHFEARYWLYFTPIFVLLATEVFKKTPSSLLLAITAIAALNAAQFHRAFQWKEAPKAYKTLKELLPEHAIAFNGNPWQFTFHTGIPSVMTPVTDAPTVIKDIARRYKVEYLVLLDTDPLRHPIYELKDDTVVQLGISEIYSDQKVRIFKFDF